MDESDSGSSVERMFEKYSKKFKKGFSSNNSNSATISITSSDPSVALVNPVTGKTPSEKKTRKGIKRPKNKRTKQNNPRNGINSDPEFIPRNYVNMTNKQLDNIASRVRIYHETGIVVSEADDVIPCQNKKYKRKNNNQLVPSVGTKRDHVGKGQIGVGYSAYRVPRCACCNLKKDDCNANLPNTSRAAVVDVAEALGLSNPDYSDAIRRLSMAGINRFKKREERLLQVQQRELLQHPELTEVSDKENSGDAKPPPAVPLTNEKRQWIQRFIDSMTPDRIDYEKPKQQNIVEGIVHSPVHEKSDELIQQVVDKYANCLDAKTIVQRIDFKKEQERQLRLSQMLNKQFKITVVSSTPNFNSTNLDQTSALTQGESTISVADLSPIRKEAPATVEAFNISGVGCIETLEAPAANENDTVSKQETADKPCDTDTANDDGYANFSHLDRSNVTTIRGPTSGRCFKPIELNEDIERFTVDSDDKGETTEDNVMKFVNDLLAGEEESINKEVEERCERLLENARQTRNILNNALDQYEQIPDLFEDHYLDGSVQIIEDGNDHTSDNDVQIVDGPSTSSSTRRRAATKRKAATVKKTSARNKKQNTGQKLVTKSTPSPNPIEVEENKDEATQQKSSTGLRDCPICLESLSNKEISSTICGHVFCTPCIVAAVRTQRNCPNCRTKLTLKKIHPLFI